MCRGGKVRSARSGPGRNRTGLDGRFGKRGVVQRGVSVYSSRKGGSRDGIILGSMCSKYAE